MRKLILQASSSSLWAEVVPEYGGMLSRLRLGDREVLRLDESLLSMAPMLAGGMPLLFPFASRTRDDAYRIDDDTYHMPFHGLVKNDAFAVAEVAEDSVAVWTGPSPAHLAAHYPFDYRLEVRYRLDETTLAAEATIRNFSAAALPHSFGWHPYFLASDKKRLGFRHHMRQRYDYFEDTDGPAPTAMDLSGTWDDVLFSPAQPEFTLDNPADGYRVRCRYSDNHQALVVCTTPSESVCLEPWRGVPDSINSGRFLEWIAPGDSARYEISLEVSPM